MKLIKNPILRLLPLCALLSLSYSGRSQSLDSLLFHKSPAPFFSLDSRNSRVVGNPVRLFGLKVGLEWAERYRAGFGFYRVTTRFNRLVRAGDQHPDVKSRFRFRYYSLFGEYRFFHNKKWTFNGTVHLGLGRNYYEPLNRPDLPERVNEKLVLLMTPHISGSYRILPWLGVGGGVGYRKTLIPGLVRTDKLNGGIVAVGVQVYPYALYKAIFENE